MKQSIFAVLAVFFLGMMYAPQGESAEYLKFEPIENRVGSSIQNCNLSGEIPVPTIAWGADIATSLANGNAKRTAPGSIFADRGLDFSLYRQDNYAQQVKDYLSCKTPFLRGTMGMINQSLLAISRDSRTAPVTIFQHSWSAGGDALVAKGNVKSLSDFRGKTIVVQRDGPHVDLMLKALRDAGLTSQDVVIKYVPDLLQIDASSFSPAMAFADDDSVAGAFVIIPDALALTSGGNVGTGSEDSVRGAHIVFSTKTANRIVSDVYVVRSDYFNANRDTVQNFVSGLLLAQERLSEIMKRSSGAEYNEVIAAAADLLLDDEGAVEDTAAMYADAEIVGYPGNVSFFGDANNPRGFAKLTGEIQNSFVAFGLMSATAPLSHAKWDYNALAAGLSNTQGVEVPKFQAAAVQQLVDRRARQNVQEEGVLFSFEIHFAANQNDFPSSQYQNDFVRAIELASTYGGALMTIEGHSDPLGYLKRKKAYLNKEPDKSGHVPTLMELNRMSTAAKNLSYSRANAVMDSLIGYAASQGVTLDSSQFGVIGHGVNQPNTPNCTRDTSGDIALTCAPASKQEWNDTRRVQFKLIQIEAESDVFSPL